ncbi:MAG: 3-phosphoshikimate 1-carboxyvinyltransferase [Ignavibacteriaceae bacterium]|nr:3-phosphoshikimate 1-carboxyvinyltransferase [Ignavibacteriaceae bacterium]
MVQKFTKIKSIQGEISLPGDKSISHRALIFSAMTAGESVIENISDGIDVRSTINCLRQLGVNISEENNLIKVQGVGYKGFKQPATQLDCGNSGTTARLLSGLLIAQNFGSKLVGDESLTKRPMKRLTDPLKLMGGKIFSAANHTLPIIIKPANELKAINYELNVPSAQIKSAILITGLHYEVETSIIESVITRDHTERLLDLEVIKENEKIISKSSIKNYPSSKKYFVPGDISSASFFIVAALLSNNSEIKIKNVSLNPTRTAIIEQLRKMGAHIEIISNKFSNKEEYGDILVRSSKLQNVHIDQKIIPSLIDEIPILTVAGAFAEGKFEIRNCKELRVKESERIKSICYNLRIAGFDVVEYEDGFSFEGRPSSKELVFDSFGDHRISMSFSVFSMLSEKGGVVKGFESVNISNPGFLTQINSICKFS